MAELLDDRDYFTLRAAQERKIANACRDHAVALAHLRLADEYERRVAEAKPKRGADIFRRAAH